MPSVGSPVLPRERISKVKVTIHRGAHTIGGSCVEISTSESRLIIDLGMPLMAKGGGGIDSAALDRPSIENGILPALDGVYNFQEADTRVEGVLLSHAHIDHYGLLAWVHPAIPVFMNRETRALLEVGNVFYKPSIRQHAVLDHCRTFTHWRAFEIGPFTITSYLMDHSAFGASSLLIEAGGKRIFYSGDLRAHGRKRKVFERLLDAPPANIDCLLLEGTTLGGKHHVGFDTEDDVERAMTEHFRSASDACFVVSAGSNIDRLVSIYKAALRSDRTLVLDLYQLHMLEQLKNFSTGLPPHDTEHVRAFFIHQHCQLLEDARGKKSVYKWRSHRIEMDDILARRRELVLRLPISWMSRIAKRMLKSGSLDQAGYIYSMWPGYAERQPEFAQLSADLGVPMTTIHTSGHAYEADLVRFAKALAPKALIPVHTLSGDEFGKYFQNVVRVGDGACYEVR